MYKKQIRKGVFGFSLIELLVVIALIGILVAIATVSYSTVQKRSRDSRRITDLKSVQQAMEQYYANSNSQYPGDCTGLSATYLPLGMPVDPLTDISYADPSFSSCSVGSYCFCVPMEVYSGNATTNCAGDTGTFYCVRSVQ